MLLPVVEEYSVKRQRKDDFNIAERINVTASGHRPIPSVVPSSGLLIAAEALVGFST